MRRSNLVSAGPWALALLAVAACGTSPEQIPEDPEKTPAGAAPSGSGGSATPSGGTGTTAGGGNSSGGGGEVTHDPGPCVPSAPEGESPLLKLSTLQYQNTVLDLGERFGLSADSRTTLESKLNAVPEDSLSLGFRGLDDRIALEHVQGYFDVALALGDALTLTSEALTSTVGTCATDSTLTAACWDTFLDGFLKTAYRRPLSDTERERLDELRSAYATPPEQLRAAIVVALGSPRFLYHVEIDGVDTDDASHLELDAYERAARLAYTFWQTLPDDKLTEAADDGSLLEKDVYQREVKRVLADPRAKATLHQFWKEWLGLEKFTGFETTRPAFQALTSGEHFGEPGHDHYRDMVQEVYDLTDFVTFTEPGTLAELLETSVSVTTSADLASLYGVEPWDETGAYPRFADGERAGLLQRGALLVSNLEQTNPFHRGALIRRRFLCGDLPQPDPNSLPAGALDPPPFDTELTTRQRFAAKVDGGVCGECHDTFSEIGYVLESFDSVGRYRTKEQVFDPETGDLLATLDVDASGMVNITSPDEPAVDGPSELNQAIVKSGKVEPCMARNYFEFVSRRVAEQGSLDACVISDLAEVLADETGGLAAAFESIALGPSFTSRRVGAQ